MIASNHRALNVLFPVSQQGASSLPNSSGMDLSNCFMILEKSDFELLQVSLGVLAQLAPRDVPALLCASCCGCWVLLRTAAAYCCCVLLLLGCL